jgi:hypothetical protein
VAVDWQERFVVFRDSVCKPQTVRKPYLTLSIMEQSDDGTGGP